MDSVRSFKWKQTANPFTITSTDLRIHFVGIVNIIAISPCTSLRIASSSTQVAVPGFEAIDEDNWPNRMGSNTMFLGLRADSPSDALLDGDWNGYKL